ncbi:MAG: S41 family peptidase [Bacteroidia bacterium]|nr:S41 family peptidase [Bacteroidia bacterium]NNF82024.1 S41 family peptidase [Flavobacteriaceae bacterium]NNK71381.1 S41 family peptidase [Flavobacteriaceae bacterium]NNL79535.1 S41 family peptidase [Flavobacteriaceae bacterium]
MKIQKKLWPLIIGLAVSAGIFIGGRMSFTDTSDRLFTSNSKKDKLNRLIDYIDYEYVDEVNTDSIVDVTVNSILDNLDPHSTYIPKEDLQRVTENMKGDFVGIGVSFYTYNDTVTVIRPLEGGPSIKAGIRGGDRILMANGEPIYGKNWSNEAVVNRLKGEKGSRIKLTIYRPGEDDLMEFKIKRNDVPIKSVDAYYMLNDNLGYIKINRFAESTYNEFKDGLDELIDKGATELVLDLRDNPGGFLGIAERIADEFLEDDRLILFTKNKKGKIEKSFASSKGDFEDGQVYVLINENSASASEIIAGALQDNDKGTIVGRRSYGKGLVQREMGLGDGSAVRLTISRYYTPTGRSIQRSYSNGNQDYFDEYYRRIQNGELSNSNKIEVDDSLKFTTPGGKIVYGGGGIIPDIFVPIDMKMKNETINRIRAMGIMNYFVFEELDKNREDFKDFQRDEFISNFEVTDAVVKRFQDYVNERARYKMPFAAYKDEVKLYLKATLAEQLFGSSASVEVLNGNDNMMEMVFELVNQP